MNTEKGKLATRLEAVAEQLAKVDSKPAEGNFIQLENKVETATEYLMRSMFPYHLGIDRRRFVEEEKRTWELMRAYDALLDCMSHISDDSAQDESWTMELINELPEILRILKTDIRAGYEGDPAAKSLDEIILTYPAFKAIGIHRIAHKLYTMNVPLIPRIMSEYAHRITGIDIHPGATIGEYFFIDHGTGVVIGETCTIGRHVKLYQHVTLGAKSFEVASDGTLVKGIKRHPDLGDNVVVYAGATILGGNTRIGDNCVIGGNVWLTHDVAPHSMVLQTTANVKE